MNIAIVQTVVENMALSALTEKSDENYTLQLKIGTTNNDPLQFVVAFAVELITSQLKFSCDFVAKFSSDTAIDDQFPSSNFAKINAPAIAYPFLRAAVAGIVVQCGYDPVYLPTINFVEFMKDK